MSKQTEFFVYLLEHYADFHDTDTPGVLNLWDELGLTDLIYDLYDIYHVERLENAFNDIDSLIAERSASKL